MTIGLTGGIGSGKTTVAAILRELGAPVIDADQVGHEVYLPGTPGWQQVVEAFGRDVVSGDGTIDRRRLAAIVFGDPAQLARLNAIVHPLIARRAAERIAAATTAHPGVPVILEAAVLIEAGWTSLVDVVWLVVAPPEAVVARLKAQRQLATEAIAARMAAQLNDEERRRHADVVIENAGTIDSLRRRVLAEWRKICPDWPGSVGG